MIQAKDALYYSVVTSLPKISVVTPCLNSVKTIRETIESVRSQNYEQWEHLVIDGGSTDGTLDVLRDYPHLMWTSEKDEGHYHAMNKGIERATGSVVNILNADDCYRPGALQSVAEEFHSHPDWDGLFGDVVYVDAEGREIYRREEAKFDYNVLRFSGVCYVCHQALFVKRGVHDRLGLYRHNDYLNCCDYEFILRLGREKCRIGHLPTFVVDFRFHQQGQSADLRVSRNQAREVLLIRRAYGCPDGVVGRILRAIYRLKRQLQKVAYRGKVDFIPGHWKLRKHMREHTEFSSNIGLDKL